MYKADSSSWATLRSLLGVVAVVVGGGLHAQCGTTVYDPGGTGNYPSNSNWVVTYCPTIPGQVVTLNFTAFNTEAGYDVLFIHNGSTTGDELIGQHHGTISPGVVTSTSSDGCLTLRFVSDGIFQYAGWTATVTCGSPPSSCGSTIYDPGGTGNYGPYSYWVRTYCPSTPGQALTLTFSQFNVENGYDFLSIYSGAGTGGPFHGTYSGTALPPSVTSVSPDGCITLFFTSDDILNYSGWVATATCAPQPSPPTGTCTLLLSLNDAANNGWGSSRVGVSINGGPTTWYSVTTASNHVLLGVNPGDLVVLTYDASGPAQAQNSYSLSNYLDPCPPLFKSGSPPAAGIQFAQVVTCTPPGAAIEDCSGGMTICSSAVLANSATSTGCTRDLNVSNRGCLAGNERRGTWYFFSPSQSGTIGFLLTPMNNGAPVNVDYDFAIWGPMPNVTCPPSTPPIRCSWAWPPNAGTYLTGMGNGATDFSESDLGNGFVAPMNVVAGEVYVMYIDNFDLGSEAFQLTWNLTNGASLDCTVLPVSLVDLHAVPVGEVIQVGWTTQTEINTSAFIVEHSINGLDFVPIGQLPAAGNSSGNINYQFDHKTPIQGLNHYRIKQQDSDGSFVWTQSVAVELKRRANILLPRPNPATDLVQIDLPPELLGDFSVQLTDPTGRLIKTIRGRHGQVPSFIDLPVSNLERGSYLLTVFNMSGAVMGVGRFIRE